jgi:hypothetical protein
LGIYYEKEKFYVNVNTQDTLLTLKKKLYKLTNVPIRNQRLYFRGAELLNDKSFESYSIQNDSLLALKNVNKLKLGPFALCTKQGYELDSPTLINNRRSMIENNPQAAFQRPSKLCRSVRKDLN